MKWSDLPPPIRGRKPLLRESESVTLRGGSQIGARLGRVLFRVAMERPRVVVMIALDKRKSQQFFKDLASSLGYEIEGRWKPLAGPLVVRRFRAGRRFDKTRWAIRGHMDVGGVCMRVRESFGEKTAVALCSLLAERLGWALHSEVAA